VGQTLTASPGSWSGSPTYAYQWLSCDGSGNNCAAIPGAGSSTYQLTTSDANNTLRVQVTAIGSGGTATAQSAATAAVTLPAGPQAAFTYSPGGPVTGQSVHFDGSTSSCPNGPCTYTWADQPPTGGSWPLGSGQSIDFTFTGVGTKYATLTMTDANGLTSTIQHAVNVITGASAPSNSAAPTISGSAVQGQVLSGSNGSWNGSPTSYAYQWQDCDTSGANCTSISGATSSSYTATAADVGQTLRFVVTATNSAGSGNASSQPTAVVTASAPAPPSNTALPTISGSPVQGQALSASNGTWNGSPTSYGYQWRQCDGSGANCTDIGGATSSSYTLAAGDVGHTIRVVVNASNAGGSTPATSAATAAVTSGGGGGGSCTVTLSSLTNVNSSLTPGAVVCLAGGTYGNVSITTTPSSNATLTAAPGAHVVVAGVNIAASNITVSQLHSTGTINVGGNSPYPGFSHDVIDHNEVGPTNGYGISVMSATGTPSSFITISNNQIHDTSTTSEGDAIRLDGWHDVTITGNDIYNIKECAGNTCHTDTLQSYQGGVATSNLTITRNYIHDTNGAQGFPFLKDGDISNVTISDNLCARMISNPQVTGIWVDENIPNLVVTNNTYQGTSGGIIQSDGSSSNPSAQISHNVFDALNVKTGSSGKAYAVSEDYNIWTANDEYTFSLGPHDLKMASPGFVDPSTDDYRLASNPNGIGIDWRPADQKYGPSN
jgi:hypothetical protein